MVAGAVAQVLENITEGDALVKTQGNQASIGSLTLGSLATVTPTGTPDGTKFLRDDYSWQPVSGSASPWNEVEVDLGVIPIYSGTVDVAAASLTGTETLIVMASGNAPTGETADVWECDIIQWVAQAYAGGLHVRWAAWPGPVAGKRKILWQEVVV